MIRYRLFLLTFLLCLLVPQGSFPKETDENKQKLEEIERRIEEMVRNLGNKRAEADLLKENLQAVMQVEKQLAGRVSRLKKEVTAVGKRLKEKESEIAALQVQVGNTERQVHRRLVALYKGGEGKSLRILFSAQSPARMAEDHDFLGRIVRRDRQLLADYRRQVAELEQNRQQLATLNSQRQSTLADLRRQQKDQRRTIELKEKLLAQVRRDETALRREIAELRERAERLSSLIKRLESAKTREYTRLNGPFAERRGRLPWPAEGPIRIGFGTSRHPDLGTMHDSQGIELVAGAEKPVKAVSPGRVIFADQFRGFGNLLILDHGDGYYTLYAQASRLIRRVGDQAKEGEILAYTGFEGGRGLYFEVRHHGVPLNPVDWLAPR